MTKVLIVGAGIAGLSAAAALAARGVEVVVVERAAVPGGKLRQVTVAGRPIDSGPTVFTMRWVFDELFDGAGASFDHAVKLSPLHILARHAWDDGSSLDLFNDVDLTAEAIGLFAGHRDADGYRRFCRDSAAVYATLEQPFLRSDAPRMTALFRSAGLFGLKNLLRIRPFTKLSDALGDYFRDPRLIQLFGRYATYCGSSPYASPATLMLVPHVERIGVWSVDGGMAALARAICDLAKSNGATLHCSSEVRSVIVERKGIGGVVLADGERLQADAVILNADVAALSSGAFGDSSQWAAAPVHTPDRSLSAMTFSLVARTRGFALARHNVFFSRDYAAEFASLFRTRAIPADPTVYVCAQDRGDSFEADTSERLFALINAPANGDSHDYTASETEQCLQRVMQRLTSCGLRVEPANGGIVATTPTDFARMFPATGGALYGRNSHGWRATFQRPGVRTRVPGLYLAGGSTHPGPGVPMAALAGRAAAAALLSDLTSRARWGRTAMHGGTSMH